MADQKTAEAKLTKLRDLVAHARAMPMSASCVMNRGDVLAAIDDVIDNLPDEIAEAQDVIENSRDAKAAEGEAQAERITEEARERAAELATETEVDQGRPAEGRPDRGRGRGRRRGAAAGGRRLRRLADGQLRVGAARTTSQVRTARARLAERSRFGPPRGRRRRRRRALDRRCRHHGRSRDLAHHDAVHRRLDRRSGLVLDTHDLGRRAGELRTVQSTVPAPSELGIAVIRVPEGSPLELDLRLEAVVEGVLVTGTVLGAARGRVRPLPDRDLRRGRGGCPGAVHLPREQATDEEASQLDGELIDLEPVLRDAIVLELPFQPAVPARLPRAVPGLRGRSQHAVDHNHDDCGRSPVVEARRVRIRERNTLDCAGCSNAAARPQARWARRVTV